MRRPARCSVLQTSLVLLSALDPAASAASIKLLPGAVCLCSCRLAYWISGIRSQRCLVHGYLSGALPVSFFGCELYACSAGWDVEWSGDWYLPISFYFIRVLTKYALGLAGSAPGVKVFGEESKSLIRARFLLQTPDCCPRARVLAGGILRS